MYTKNDWLQVWLAMPGVANQSSTLFWLRPTNISGVFPFASVVAGDAASFFAATWGFTSTHYNSFGYLHAYVSTTDFGPITRDQSVATFPFPVPTVHWAPALCWCWVRPVHAGQVTWRNAGFSVPITKSEMLSGDPVSALQSRIDSFKAMFVAGFTSAGRHYIPVSVSYLHRDWKDVTDYRVSRFPAGRIKRQKMRPNEIIGNVPKILP